jgi:hypothetical protein
MPEVKIKFDHHGLGDCVHFAHVLQLYKRRGFDVTVQAEPNKLFVWQVAGVKVAEQGGLTDHPFIYPWQFEDLNQPDHLGNKVAHNLEVDQMPRIGSREELWPELCQVRLSAREHVSTEARAEATRFLEGLPRPIICLHSRGTNWQERKSLPIETDFNLILALLDRTGGSVVVLDFDRRAPMVGDARCKGIKPSWGHIGIDRLCALYEQADLMIGVDSGPLHVAALTDIKALGIFRQIPPVRCCLPNPNATYMVPGKLHEQWERRKNLWRFTEYAGDEPTAREIADVAVKLLETATKATPEPEKGLSAAGLYTYRRVGYDERPMELLPDGNIGEGRGDCEQRWSLRGGTLYISGGHGAICTCSRSEDGVYRGRWLLFERMPIEMVPASRTAETKAHRITLVTNWDDDYEHIASIVEQNRREYAAVHGYGIIERHYPGSWGKLNALLDAWNDSEWLWWLDADACITDTRQKLESLIREDADVVITCDRNGINCGSMLIRPCPQLKAIFEELLHRRSDFDWPNGLWEQNGLMWMLWKIKDRVYILPQHTMNSFATSDAGSHAWQPGDFVLHCPGLPDEKRVALLTQAVRNAKGGC